VKRTWGQRQTVPQPLPFLPLCSKHPTQQAGGWNVYKCKAHVVCRCQPGIFVSRNPLWRVSYTKNPRWRQYSNSHDHRSHNIWAIKSIFLKISKWKRQALINSLKACWQNKLEFDRIKLWALLVLWDNKNKKAVANKWKDVSPKYNWSPVSIQLNGLS